MIDPNAFLTHIPATPAPQAAPSDGGEALKSMIDKGLTAIAQIAPVSPATKTWPEEIYLSTGEDDELAPFGEYSEVSWCDHPTNSVDVRYVREDVVARAAAWRAAAAPLTQAADRSAANAPVAKSDDDLVKIAAQRVRIMELEDQVARVSGDFEELQSASAVAELSATPAAPLAQQSVPIGYVANTAHGWQFRTAAPDENSQWAGMWRAVGYISAQQSEPWEGFDVERTGDAHYDAGNFLLNAAQEFWQSCRNVGQCGAVQWVTGSNGELLIYTRGEYRETLMTNIIKFADQPVKHFAAPLPAQQASERDAKDAARYRWFRACSEDWDQLDIVDGRGNLDPEAFDREIDAALAAMGDARKGEPS